MTLRRLRCKELMEIREQYARTSETRIYQTPPNSKSKAVKHMRKRLQYILRQLATGFRETSNSRNNHEHSAKMHNDSAENTTE